MIVLDTTACIDFLKGNEGVKKILLENEDLIYLTSITIYEINIGLQRTKRVISPKRFEELNKIWQEFLSGIEIFSLGVKEAEKTAEIHDYLDSSGKIIDDNDILIIGIMLTNGIKKIITKNVSHFKRVKEIEVLSY